MRGPSIEDLLINERIMGKCNHLDFDYEEVMEYGQIVRYLVCTSCDEKFYDVLAYTFDHKPKKKRPRNYLSLQTPSYGSDYALAQMVVRHLKSRGWDCQGRRRNKIFTYIISKGRDSFVGEEKATEHAAICSAASKLARSPVKVN